MVEAMEVIALPAQEGELSSSGCFLASGDLLR